MSPLQLAVYWRLSLVFSFTSFLFFLDIFTAAVVADTCRRGNGNGNGTGTGARPPPPPLLLLLRGTSAPNARSNQSQPGEVSEAGDDWRKESGQQDSVCDWTDWLSYSQTFFMVGLLLGSLFGGAISDRYGKRPVLLVCVCVHAVCGLVPAVLPQPFVFLAVRCLTGVCCCCINICSFSLAVEWTLPAARLWPPAVLPFCFSLGTMGGAPLAWLSQSWTRLHLSLALPQLVCLPLYLYVSHTCLSASLPVRHTCLSASLPVHSRLPVSVPTQRLKEGGGHTPSDIIHLRHPTVLLRLFIMSYLR
ncbi:organic cation transporter-like protein [Perca fluviatilis]|uniref:organic cation transporter-like protein n=1 Tax=Perca fluviatilis TaxID=8168 RepID=UPI001965508E|nr:organic cation transporter-like protein [Perca fluviatilis]